MPEVLTARDGGVLTITLNRPEVYNAFNRALHDALRAALEEASDAAVRAVVITGAGRGFCAGQDLHEFAAMTGSIREALESTYHPNIRLIRALEKPVIAAVNGPAAGAGCRSQQRVTSGSPPRRPVSSPASSASASCPTRAAPGSSTACSGSRGLSSG